MTASSATPAGPVPSPLILGTMGWGATDRVADEHVAWTDVAGRLDRARERARGALRAGLDVGIRVLDTADIYGAGASERTISAVLADLAAEEQELLRGQLRVQTKCGIVLDELGPDGRPRVRYDNSPAYVRQCLEDSASRLEVFTVDTLLIHRPDVLTPVEDTVRAFLDAREAGLVRRLGVSNLPVRRVLEYQRALTMLAADGTGLHCVQLELGLHHRDLVESVVLAGHPDAPADGGVAGMAEVCLAEGIELQAWGPLAQGRFTRDLTDSAGVAGGADRADAAGGTGDPAAVVVAEVAEELQVSREAVVLAWLLKLPWGVRPVIGSQDPVRIAACAQAPAAARAMDSAQWHRLWTAARGKDLP